MPQEQLECSRLEMALTEDLISVGRDLIESDANPESDLVQRYHDIQTSIRQRMERLKDLQTEDDPDALMQFEVEAELERFQSLSAEVLTEIGQQAYLARTLGPDTMKRLASQVQEIRKLRKEEVPATDQIAAKVQPYKPWLAAAACVILIPIVVYLLPKPTDVSREVERSTPKSTSKTPGAGDGEGISAARPRMPAQQGTFSESPWVLADFVLLNPVERLPADDEQGNAGDGSDDGKQPNQDGSKANRFQPPTVALAIEDHGEEQFRLIGQAEAVDLPAAIRVAMDAQTPVVMGHGELARLINIRTKVGEIVADELAPEIPVFWRRHEFVPDGDWAILRTSDSPPAIGVVTEKTDQLSRVFMPFGRRSIDLPAARSSELEVVEPFELVMSRELDAVNVLAFRIGRKLNSMEGRSGYVSVVVRSISDTTDAADVGAILNSRLKLIGVPVLDEDDASELEVAIGELLSEKADSSRFVRSAVASHEVRIRPTEIPQMLTVTLVRLSDGEHLVTSEFQLKP